MDLTADAERLWGLDGQMNLDRHLPDLADRPDSPTDDLHQISEINRAIGVLLTQNFTLGQAREHLHQIAVEHHVTEFTVAAHIIHAR